MKKFICLLLAFSAVFSLCGCGKKDKNTDKLTLSPGLYTVGKEIAPGVYSAAADEASKTAYIKLRPLTQADALPEMKTLSPDANSAEVILENGRKMEVIFSSVTFRLLNTDIEAAKAAAATPEPTPETTPTPTPTPTPEPTPNVIPERGEEPLSDDTIRPEIQEFLESYETFMNEYIDFMQAYMYGGEGDRKDEYNDLIARYADFKKKVESLDDHQDELTPAERTLYQEVSARVAEKTATLGPTEEMEDLG